MRALQQWWPAAALIICAAVLGAAHAFETFGHMAPCELCLKEREVWWTAGAVALVGLALGFSPVAARGRRVAEIALAAAFLYGAVLAGYHAGVEWKFWPGPASCTGVVTQVSAAAMQALLRGAALGLPACDRPAWVFLGISMAGWNALISLTMAALSGWAAFSRRPAA